MRTILYSMLLAAAVVAVPDARAAGHSSHEVSSEFSWTEDGNALALHSHNGSGVVVTRATPEPFHGLRRGDVLLKADGRSLAQVGDLTQLLRGRTTPLALQLRRGTQLLTLSWSQADYRPFAPPPAPPPPPRP